MATDAPEETPYAATVADTDADGDGDADAESDADVEAELAADLADAAEHERSFESDRSLVPLSRSFLQVEPAVLDAEEVQALLGGLTALLRSAEATGDFPAEGHPWMEPVGDTVESEVAGVCSVQRSEHEPDPQTNRRDRRHSQLSPFAWLFPDDAGIGRSARHQQSHHLRARGRTRKKASPPQGQAQGSLFGNHL